MGNFGVKVSKPGEDATSATDKNINFTTKYSTLKLYLAGTTSFTTNGSGDGSKTISHGLSFAPAFFVWLKTTASFSFLDASTYANSYMPVGVPNKWAGEDGNGYSYSGNIHAYTDSSNLVIVADAAKPSTTYYFKYYILIDLSKDYSGADGLTLSNNYGMKVSKSGIDVRTAKEYELGYSSKYKSLQYYDVSFKEETLTLPEMFASQADTGAEEGTYVDINHGLGYPPFYMVYFKSTDFTDTSLLVEAPYCGINPVFDIEEYQVSTFCNSTKIRVSFYRESQWNAFSGLSNSFSEGTISMKVYVFTEDLSQSSL